MRDQPAPGEQRLSLASNLDAMGELLIWFETVWPNNGDDSQEILRIQAQTALVEAFSNVVRHAHGSLTPAPEMELIFRRDAAGFSFDVIDQGCHFRPEDQFAELRRQLIDGEAHPSQREHHWGLVMFIRLIDQHGWSISSEQLNQRGNILRLSHRWNPSSPKTD